MVKSNPNAPQLTVTPESLDFGITNSSKTLLLKNTGTGTLNWTANTNDSWIVISANSGSTTGGNTSSLTVTLNKSGLSANNYTGTILLNSNGGSQVVNVTMTVQQGTLDPPTLQIIGNPTKTFISLGWTKVSSTNFDNYKLYRSVAGNVDESGTLVTTITNSDQNTFTDDGLNSGTVYYYKVYVYSKTGIGSASNEVNATTSRSLGSWVSTETISSLDGGISVNSMYIITENDIWLCGNDEMWHYNGSTWTMNFKNNLSGYGFTGISFVSQNKGYAIFNPGSQGSLYEYSGISWTKVPNLTLDHPNDIIAFSESNIWILGSGKVYHFDGSNWTTANLDISGLDLDAISANDIWALGYRAAVFHYNGVGWAFINGLDGSFVSISANSQNDVWVASSSDGSSSSSPYSGLWHYDGNMFDKNYKISEGSYYGERSALKMISFNEGWSSFERSPYSLSYFDGNSWQIVANPVSSAVYCIKFLTRDKGWAVTKNGTILRYVE